MMSCGAMLLVNRIKDGSAQDLGFRDRESIVFYDTPAELFELIDYYLKNDHAREKIAEAGYKLVLERHIYKQRLKEILRLIS
jgi:spore maturation protein CgeB